MMRTRLAMRNMVASLMLQIVVALSGFIVPRLFTVVYGSAVNGLVASINQFITYMGVVEVGIGAASTVALYGPIAKKDKNEISRIISAGRAFYIRSGFIFLFLVGILAFYYPYIVQNEIEHASFVRFMILILSVNGIVDYFFLGKYRILLQADQRGYIICIVQMIGTILVMILSICLMQGNQTALVVKLVAAILYVMRSIVIAMYVRYHYQDISFREKPNMLAFTQRWSALFHQIVGVIVNNTAVVLLTLCVCTNALIEISVYSVYSMVSYGVSSIMVSISNGLGSSFGQIISQKEKDILYKSFSIYEFWFYMIIFIAHTSMLVLFYPFVCVYSVEFVDAVVYPRKVLVVLFSLVGLIQCIRLPGLTLICAAGHYKETRGRAFIELSIYIFISLFLVKKLGIVGIMIAMLISYLYRTIDVILYVENKFVRGTIKNTL